MVDRVYSSILQQHFAVADNTPRVEAFCPIDRTQLVSISEYDFSHYSCSACGATYRWGDKNRDSILVQARTYLTGIQKQVEKSRTELQKLEIILLAAEQTGLLSKT